jgi:hypothetical protein
MMLFFKEQILNLFFLHVVFKAAHWMRSWTILSKEKAKVQLRDGAHVLEVQTLSFFSKAG